MGPVVGYEPRRIAVLQTRASAAVAHLAACRIDDPAAADAVRTAVAATSTLEARLLAALARIAGSDALLSWHATAPMPPGPWFDGLRGLRGTALGTALAERAAVALVDDHDELRDAITVASTDADAITVASTDADAMLALVEGLGPAGLLRLIDRLGRAAPSAAGGELAAALRAAFVVAAPRLDARFAAQLVTAAADARHAASATAGTALAFLYAGPQLPAELLVASLRALRDVEVRAAATRGQGPADGAALWIPTWLPPAVGRLAEELGAGAGSPVDPLVTLDPMYALLRQLAHDGAAGRRLFTDGDVAAYVFGSRDVLADGGRAVTAAAAAAAARDGLEAGAPDATRRGAMLVASGFVNHFGATAAGPLVGRRDEEVSRAVADIVGRHLPSVQQALVPGMGNDGDLVPAIGIAPGSLEVFDPAGGAWRAQLRRGELRSMIDLAVDTDAATAALRAHVSAFEIVTAHAAASRLAAGTVPTEPSRWLDEQLGDAARFEGLLVEHVGHRAEARGRDRDRFVERWFDAIGSGTELAAGTFTSPAAAAVVTPVVDPLADRLAEHFGGHADAAADATDAMRWAWSQRLLYVWSSELLRAGAIEASVPDALVADGGLVPLDALAERVARVRRDATDATTATYDVGSLFRALDTASGTHLDDAGLVDRMDAGFARSRAARD